MNLLSAIAGVAVVVSVSGCGDCAGVELSRLGVTEQTIAVGQSFVATYEEGGSCNGSFEPVPGRVQWSTAETTVVDVDSLACTFRSTTHRSDSA